MEKLLLIVNPNAGRNGYRSCLSDVLHELHKDGFQTTVVFTDRHGDAPRLVREVGREFKHIICMGGDGTLNETLSGLMELTERPVLGYIPMGTTNDSATTLGISRDPVLAARTAARGTPAAVDVGRFNDGNFFYVAAFGAFTEVSYETPQDRKNTFGSLAYILEALGRLPRLSHHWCRVEHDNGAEEGDFIFGAVSNSRSIAGLIRLNESVDVSLSDGIFEILLIRTPESALQLGPIISDILANKFTNTNKSVLLLRSRRVRFVFREAAAWTIDGEDGGRHDEVVCENLPHSACVMVGGPAFS